jgi:hypothetical protein
VFAFVDNTKFEIYECNHFHIKDLIFIDLTTGLIHLNYIRCYALSLGPGLCKSIAVQRSEIEVSVLEGKLSIQYSLELLKMKK